MKEFCATLRGKVVLSGEHAVIRGGSAVVLPSPEKYFFRVQFSPESSGDFVIVPKESAASVMKVLSLLQTRIPSLELPSGKLEIQSTLPMGGGLGSSAALCVGILRWLQEELRIQEGDFIEIARFLEAEFHGKSSGMDLASVHAGRPILFHKKKTTFLEGKVPFFQLHDTGERAATLEQVQRVEALWQKDPSFAKATDRQMEVATQLACRALRSHDFSCLRESTLLSFDCFERWGLLSSSIRAQRNQLLSQGAYAVRLTGAGLGGFLLSFWLD